MPLNDGARDGLLERLLRGVGVGDAAIDAGFPRLWDRYLHHLGERLPGHPMNVLPGVTEVLEALAAHDDVAMGLLTGNILRGAELKLRSVGLFDHFRTGSYGSDSERRDDLAPIAIERARKTWNLAFDPKDVWVVGDTPNDVRCGQAGGTRTFGVATGRFGTDALLAAGADRVVEDLVDTRRAVTLLLD